MMLSTNTVDNFVDQFKKSAAIPSKSNPGVKMNTKQSKSLFVEIQ